LANEFFAVENFEQTFLFPDNNVWIIHRRQQLARLTEAEISRGQNERAESYTNQENFHRI
jgi:hypothetical protein